MSDLKMPVSVGAGVPAFVKLVDNGDGTYSISTSSSAGGGGGMGAQESTLQSLLSAVQAQKDNEFSVWTDNGGSYYLMRIVVDSSGASTITFTTPTGTAATPGAGLRPAGSAGKQVTSQLFDATASGSGGAGWASGEVLTRLLVTDVATNASTIIWLNASGAAITGVVIGTNAKAQSEETTVTVNALTASGKTAVSGTFSATGQSAAFAPVPGRDFNIVVNFGAAVGAVQVERTFDGSTWLPLTASGVAIMRFSATANEQWSDSEVGVQYRLNCTSLSSGSIAYRISQ